MMPSIQPSSNAGARRAPEFDHYSRLDLSDRAARSDLSRVATREADARMLS
jgi:hypothetical protein